MMDLYPGKLYEIKLNENQYIGATKISKPSFAAGLVKNKPFRTFKGFVAIPSRSILLFIEKKRVKAYNVLEDIPYKDVFVFLHDSFLIELTEKQTHYLVEINI